eukprot:9119589-Prorocentrum_lima.AAC.1
MGSVQAATRGQELSSTLGGDVQVRGRPYCAFRFVVWLRGGLSLLRSSMEEFMEQWGVPS